MVNYVLFETAFGYALFERLQSEEIGAKLEQVQNSVEDFVKFGKTVKLQGFAPFKNAVHALENANDISEGIVNDHLKNFLEITLPKPSKKKKNNAVLGVVDKNLAGSIKSELGYECETSELVLELVRGIRLHSDKLLNQVKDNDLEKAQLGLGHSYSRAKVKFNVNRADNMIIQAISLLDQLDKDVNTFAMRVREWYSWHFPELVKIVNDNYQYAKLAKFIKNKSDLTEEQMDDLVEITGDESKAKQILDAAKASMGTDISELDMINIVHFTDRVIELADYRKKMHSYLLSKMHNVAPNLSALIGEVVGARLISHAGSLTNLSKYPASTVQILGAEKALFRALKTKGNTPKYGLLYHSSFIGRAGAKNKGRISRFLANKCTIASRIDCFAEKPTSKFGEALKGQVEERLDFYERGSVVSKNLDVIAKVIKDLEEESAMDVDEKIEEVGLGKRKASLDSPEILPKKPKLDESNVKLVEKTDATKKKKSKKKSKKSDAEKILEETSKKAESEKKKVNNGDVFFLDIPLNIKSEKNEVTQVMSKSNKKKKDKKEDVASIKETPKSDKKKKEKKDEEILSQESPKSDKKKKEKKGEESLTQETPKSDKKKKEKKGEETLTQETPKSDKKKKEKKDEETLTQESPKSDKKKKNEETLTQETPKSDKKKDKKSEETPTQETPKSDKKKKDKKGEVTTTNETPKSGKKDKKGKETPKSEKKKQKEDPMEIDDIPKSDKKKKKK